VGDREVIARGLNLGAGNRGFESAILGDQESPRVVDELEV
jgi:hypothetical protein